MIVNTGHGKGKTTTALGVLMRAWGRDMKVVMLQFIKHTTANFGEQRAARKMGVTVGAMGDGFTWRSRDLEASADLARALWQDASELIAGGEYQVVILDESPVPCTTAPYDAGIKAQPGIELSQRLQPHRMGP